MRAFHYRPLASGAAYLRRTAKRLAAKVGDNGGVKVEIHDGYLLRAAGGRASVMVVALDPAAVWLFLHHQTPPGGELQRVLGVRQFDRGEIAGSGVDAPVEPSGANALERWVAGVGYVGSVDTGALGLLPNVPALASVRRDRASTTTLGSTADYVIGAVPFATRFQLYGVSFDPQRVRVVAAGRDMGGVTATYTDLTDWVLRESALGGLLGDAHARLQVRLASSYPWYSVPVFAAQTARDAIVQTAPGAAPWYADVVVAGGYASQDAASPRLGVAGVFLARLRRPEVPPADQYPLTPVWQHALPLIANAEPEFVPAVITPYGGGTTRISSHGVTGVGMAYAAGDGTDDLSLLVVGVHCTQGEDTATPTEWVGLQAHRVTLGGTLTSSTLRKTTDDTQWHIGHEVALFGQNGVGVVEAPIAGGRIDQSSLSLWHVGMDGVMRETGLKAAGWQPFTDYLLNPTSKTVGAVYGQTPRPWCALGDDKVAVLARDYSVGLSDTVQTLTLVVLDQLTGAFVEARGVVATDAALISGRAFLSVIVPETRKADDSVVPAVLLCGLGSQTRISRDGGLTWTLLFEGYIGLPVYLGNRLHRVELGQGL